MREATLAEDPRVKLQGAELGRFAYPGTIRSYGPPDGAQLDENGFIEMTRENAVEHIKEVRHVSGVVMKIADGWLTGRNNGEWGGAS